MLRAEVAVELELHLSALLAAARGVLIALDGIFSTLGAPVVSPGPIHPSPQETRLINAVSQLNHMRASLPENVVITALLGDIPEGCNAIAPVNRLPNEILSYIFELTQDAQGSLPNAPARQAFILSSVCHTWKEIATSTCALWDTFVIQNLSSSRIGELCTARSGERDLKVAVYLDSGYTHGGFREAESAGHRWRDITILYLYPRGWVMPDLGAYLEEIMRYAKPLATHSLTHSHKGLARLSLVNLDYDLNVVQLDSALRIPSQLRVLRLFSVRLAENWTRPGVVMDNPLVLVHLEELAMTHACPLLCSYIFANLVAPRLQSFEEGCPSSIDHLIGPFFARTASILRLQLDCCPSSQLVGAIPSLMNLETLALGAAGWEDQTDQICSLLSRIPKKACPNLHKLYFKMSYPPDCQDIQKFIEMRASTSGVLQIRLISFDCLRDHNSSKDRELEKEWYSARVEVALWKFKHQPWGASREIEAY